MMKLPPPLIKTIFKFVDLQTRYQLRYVSKQCNTLIPFPSLEDLSQFMRTINDKIKTRHIKKGERGSYTENLSDLILNPVDFSRLLENSKDVDTKFYENLIKEFNCEYYRSLIERGSTAHPSIVNPKNINLDVSEFVSMLKQSYFNYRFVICCHGGNYKSSHISDRAISRSRETCYYSFRFDMGERDWDGDLNSDDFEQDGEMILPHFNPWEWIDLVNLDQEEDSEMWILNCCRESKYYGRIYRFEHQRGENAEEFQGVSLKSFIHNFPLYLKNKYKLQLKEEKDTL